MQEQNSKVTFGDFKPGNASFFEEINHYFGNIKENTI